MKCPHCSLHIHNGFSDPIPLPWGSTSTDVYARTQICPECKESIVQVLYNRRRGAWRLVVPAYDNRGFDLTSVPGPLAEDYLEAVACLDVSAKASAALSRRCLQGMLSGAGYTQKDLAKQIDALLSEPDAAKAIPSALRHTVDAIRNFGNFSAHPIDDKTTLQVVDVEPEEAEWCLEVIEAMFDHFYVQPAAAAVRKAALDTKLAAAGKPPSK